MTEVQKAGDVVVTITRKIENGQLLSVSIKKFQPFLCPVSWIYFI
jgi:hypothetical protein